VNGVERSDHAIETDLFGGIETRYPDLFQSIVSGRLDIDIELFVHTVLMLRSRSPAFREAFELALADFVESHISTIPKGEIPPPPKDFPNLWDQLVITIDPHRSIQAMAYYITNYATILTRLEWSIRRAPKNSNLLTSDNPVVWYEKGYGNSLPSIFPQVPTSKTRAILPITPKLALVGKVSPAKDFRYIGYSGELSSQQVREINELQLACSWDDVVGKISLPKTRFDQLKEVAPRMLITEFNPDNGHFLIWSTYLNSIRNKHKFSRRTASD
jgi:hypothetical protein